MFNSNRVRLAVLTLLHFSIDFYTGFRGPIIPTLQNHLSVSLAHIIYLTSLCGIVVNAVQPTFGAFIARKGFPLILVIGPVMATVMSLVGLTDSFVVTAVIFGIAALGIGLVHPEAAMAANDISSRRLGLGMSIFMSGGYFGFSSGSLVAAWWAQEFGLRYFWLLGIPGVLVAVLVYLTKLHKYRAHVASNSEETNKGTHSFWPVFIMGLMLATNIVILMNFFTVYIVKKFGSDYQAFAGSGLFCFGIAGALGGCFWGHMSEGRSRVLMILLATLIALPFTYTFFMLENTSLIILWLIVMGLTMGACFPITVILAQSARQFTRVLRTGLAIGGTWGGGMAMVGFAGYFTKYYSAEEIMRFSTLFFLTGSILVSGLMYFYREKR